MAAPPHQVGYKSAAIMCCHQRDGSPVTVVHPVMRGTKKCAGSEHSPKSQDFRKLTIRLRLRSRDSQMTGCARAKNLSLEWFWPRGAIRPVGFSREIDRWAI